MKEKIIYGLLVLGICAGVMACGGKSSKVTSQPIQHPDFDADSAYQFIADQVYLGPRVPGTPEHEDCIVYLAQKLRDFGAEVTLQKGYKTNYAGEQQQIINIIGHFDGNSESASILLCAHYDSRPWCDEEEEYTNRFQAVLGANDGASGVGVLLEIARQIGLSRANGTASLVPIDIVFFDCEDMGTPLFYTGMQREHTWCLGSQLWSEQFAYGKDKPVSERYEYGILLDMVGAPNAMFPKEYYSTQAANNYVENIWNTAQKLGFEKYFVSDKSLPIIDDHYYIVHIAGVPCVDVIHYNVKGNIGFPSWWHTTQDNMSNIDKNTLQAVGETILLCLNY